MQADGHGQQRATENRGRLADVADPINTQRTALALLRVPARDKRYANREGRAC